MDSSKFLKELEQTVTEILQEENFEFMIPPSLKPATHIWDDDFGLQTIVPDDFN